jgi:hypothetical protein
MGFNKRRMEDARRQEAEKVTEVPVRSRGTRSGARQIIWIAARSLCRTKPMPDPGNSLHDKLMAGCACEREHQKKFGPLSLRTVDG